MEWFKHLSDASTDQLVMDLEEILGHSGYAFWFKTLELITKEMRPDSPRCCVQYSLRNWIRLLRTREQKLRTFLDRIKQEPGINVEETPIKLRRNSDKTQFLIKVTVDKSLKLRDSRNSSRAKRGTIDKEVDKSKSKSKMKLAAPASPKVKPKPKKTLVPQAYLDARDTGTWPVKEKDALIKAAGKYGYINNYAWKMFVDFVNKKEASGYQAISWVAAFRNQCDGVANKGWDGPTGREIMKDDPGAGMQEFLKKEAAETKEKMESGYYDGK